jgi:hypothetical protein
VPGAAAIEPSFSELEPGVLRFTIQPLDPNASAFDRREVATQEMRRQVGDFFGCDALHWFDESSEEWRHSDSGSQIKYGAFFGNSYDRNGLLVAKVYYEMAPGQCERTSGHSASVTATAKHALPNLMPLFTSIACRRMYGSRRTTFLHRGVLRLTNLKPLLDELGLSNHLGGVIRTLSLVMGDRFELPDGSVLVALDHRSHATEFEIYILLRMIPDLPGNFLDLVAIGLSERPRELEAMLHWLAAFTPESGNWPGDFSVFSVKISREGTPRVSLYLRPAEFEIRDCAREQDYGMQYDD